MRTRCGPEGRTDTVGTAVAAPAPCLLGRHNGRINGKSRRRVALMKARRQFLSHAAAPPLVSSQSSIAQRALLLSVPRFRELLSDMTVCDCDQSFIRKPVQNGPEQIVPVRRILMIV